MNPTKQRNIDIRSLVEIDSTKESAVHTAVNHKHIKIVV